MQETLVRLKRKEGVFAQLEPHMTNTHRVSYLVLVSCVLLQFTFDLFRVVPQYAGGLYLRRAASPEDGISPQDGVSPENTVTGKLSAVSPQNGISPQDVVSPQDGVSPQNGISPQSRVASDYG